MSQSAPGVVRGVTTTQGGTVFLPGVAVVLTDPTGSRQPITGASDDSGRFAFGGVAPGAYEVRASLAGFEDTTAKVRVEPGAEANVSVDLPVAKVSESVNVVDRAPNAVPTTQGDTISGSELNRTPLKGDNYQALLPMLPGVVRGSDGRIRMAGGEPTQSGLQVSSASVTDPSTGDFALDLPGDAVESVSVLEDPYSAEYGRFSSGVTQIQTRRGGDRWQIIPNSFIPRLQMNDQSHAEIAAFTPRVSVGGPLIPNTLFLSQSAQYRLIRSEVRTLPGDPNTEVRSFDSYTRLDANLTGNNAVTAAFAVYPRTIEGVGLSTFNPLIATSTFNQGGFNAGVSDKATLSPTSILETTFNVKQYDVDVFGRGRLPMEFTTTGIGGNYFNQQTRNTRSIQAVSTLTFAPTAASAHLFKVGVDVLAASYDGTSTSQPVEIRRADGTLAERIAFGGPTAQRASGTDFSAFAQDQWKAGERLQIEAGIRFDRDGVLGGLRASPRSGFTVALNDDASAVLRGGVGLFYQRTPLSVAAFDSMEGRVVTTYAADGVTPLDVLAFTNVTSPLSTPRAVVGNVEYDQRLGTHVLLKANVLRRHGDNEFIVEPSVTPEPTLLLTSTGQSDHWEGELTTRITPSARTDLTVSYVRSRSEADLNSFDSYFGNFRNPIIVPNQYSFTTTDVPNRLLVRGTVGLPSKLQISPVLEVRSGFPYTLVNQEQQVVGVRDQGGRYPTLATLDLSLDRAVKVRGIKARIGIRVFNVLNRFNPRDVMNNVDSPLYGGFFNPIPRSIGLNFWIDR